jgi:hypothetical protein
LRQRWFARTREDRNVTFPNRWWAPSFGQRWFARTKRGAQPQCPVRDARAWTWHRWFAWTSEDRNTGIRHAALVDNTQRWNESSSEDRNTGVRETVDGSDKAELE